MTDASGAVVVRESFDSFGKRRGSTWTGAPSAGDMTAIGGISRQGYTGHEQLDNLKLVHMNRRVYDPAIGRFMSADPFIDDGAGRQGLNRFSYVGNNPLSFTDPSGYERTCDWVYYEQIGIPLPNGVRTETKYPTFECPDPSDPPPGVGSGAGAAENGSDDKVELSTVDSHECTIFDFIEDVKNAVREAYTIFRMSRFHLRYKGLLGSTVLASILSTRSQ